MPIISQENLPPLSYSATLDNFSMLEEKIAGFRNIGKAHYKNDLKNNLSVISLIDDIVMAKSSVKHALRSKSVVEPADHEMHVYKSPVKSKKKTSRKHLNDQALDEQVELPNVSTAEKDFNFDDIIPRPEIDENDEEGDADDDQIIPPFVYFDVPKVEEEDQDERETGAKKKKQRKKVDFAKNHHGELYDMVPLRYLRKPFKRKRRRKTLMENTSKWFVRFTEAVQIPKNTPKTKWLDVVYKSPFESTFKVSKIRKQYELPEKYVKYNRSGCPDKKGDNSVLGSQMMSHSYVIDEMDQLWIDAENGKRTQIGEKLIRNYDFLKIIDTLETDVYLSKTKILLQQVGFNRSFFDSSKEASCDVCYDDNCADDDNILFCDGCETIVHQKCYGIHNIPSDEWLCDVCLLTNRKPRCVVCPLHTGAMKRSSCRSGFLHISCALWIPDVLFDDPDNLEGISVNVRRKNAKRALELCQVCNVKYGGCLTCSAEGCKNNYHVTCGQRTGFYFNIDKEDDDIKMISYCRKHTIERLPPNTLMYNKFIRDSPQISSEELEKYFTIFTESETNEKLKDLDKDLIADVYEYWKIKRLDKGGPLVCVGKILEEFVPIFKEEPMRKNEIRLRLEPNSSRMAADNMRTLMWMIQDRENKKLISARNLRNLLEDVVKNDKNADNIDEIMDLITEFVDPAQSLPIRRSESPIDWNTNDEEFVHEFDLDEYLKNMGKLPKETSIRQLAKKREVMFMKSRSQNENQEKNKKEMELKSDHVSNKTKTVKIDQEKDKFAKTPKGKKKNNEFEKSTDIKSKSKPKFWKIIFADPSDENMDEDEELKKKKEKLDQMENSIKKTEVRNTRSSVRRREK